MTSELTFAQAMPFIAASLEAGQTPALLGEPGIGKSSLIEDLAAKFKTMVFTLPVNQLADRADLTGVRMVQNEETGNWSQMAFPHFKIMDAVHYAEQHPNEHPILFLDEFNRATSDITSAILSFQTERSIGSIKFPDNLRIIVAGNDKGNVTSLDQASISRFAVYHVRPDLDTFMSIQTLNPFVTAVLTKYPDDLMAMEFVENSTSSPDGDDDSSSDEEEEFKFNEHEFLTEGTFTQITRPRTITYVSRWLDVLGLDKSGSDKEKELLGSMFSSMTDTDNDNVLFVGIAAHVGRTTFAHNLFDEIQTHFNSILSSTHVSSQPLLQALRPNQAIINELSSAPNVPEVEKLILKMSDKERMNTLVWLVENTSTKEINNNDAVIAFMANAPHHIKQFDNDAIKNLMLILPNSARVSDVAVKALLGTSATMMNQWRAMIESVIEQD